MFRWSNLCSAVFMVSFICPVNMSGQVKDPFNQARQQVTSSNSSVFNKSRQSNFNDYRQKLNIEYIHIIRQPWKGFNAFRGIVAPDRDDKPVVPVKFSEDETKREIKDRELGYSEIERPILNKSVTQPIAPVTVAPDDKSSFLSFHYLGSAWKVRKPANATFRLKAIDENAIADGWKMLSDNSYNAMLADCIKLKSSHRLCDWAYLMMLKSLAEQYCGKNTNEATLLMAYLYSQSGYKLRLAKTGSKLYLLYGTKHKVYDTPYFDCDGERFYSLEKVNEKLYISAAKFSKEQSMSLWVGQVPVVENMRSVDRMLTSKRYPDMSVNVSINKNLLSLYESYPVSEVGGNFMTRWAMYANVPLCSDAREQLYPQLRRSVSGLSQLDAVNKLLNWVQTAFVYEYDDKVWGRDRAFFPDETLYYPYCDCEDRSILMSRLIRDLLGLKCILIYYPGHLAMAVNFTDDVRGDYIMLNNKKYVVCDPTYIGAPVGMTMPGMDNFKAKVILLE